MEDLESPLLPNIRSAFYVLLLLGLLTTATLLFFPLTYKRFQLQLNAPAVRVFSATTDRIFSATKATKTTYYWDAMVSLKDSDRENIISDNKMDIRAWLYYRNVLVSTTRLTEGKFRHAPEGDEMWVRVSFKIDSTALTGIKEDFKEDYRADRVLMFDVLMEGNVTVNPGSWLREKRAFLMIDCNDVKIQSRWNYYGELLGDKRCQSQMLPGKLDVVYKRRDFRIVNLHLRS